MLKICMLYNYNYTSYKSYTQFNNTFLYAYTLHIYLYPIYNIYTPQPTYKFKYFCCTTDIEFACKFYMKQPLVCSKIYTSYLPMFYKITYMYYNDITPYTYKSLSEFKFSTNRSFYIITYEGHRKIFY